MSTLDGLEIGLENDAGKLIPSNSEKATSFIDETLENAEVAEVERGRPEIVSGRLSGTSKGSPCDQFCVPTRSIPVTVPM